MDKAGFAVHRESFGCMFKSLASFLVVSFFVLWSAVLSVAQQVPSANASQEKPTRRDAKNSDEQSKELVAYEVTFPSMGTLLSLKTFATDEDAVEEVFKATRAEIDRLAFIFTDYDEESETRKLTEDDRVGKWQKVSPELWEVLKISDQWNRQTDGAFDVSVGRLSLLWRSARSKNRIPTSEQIAEAMRLLRVETCRTARRGSLCVHPFARLAIGLWSGRQGIRDRSGLSVSCQAWVSEFFGARWW